MKRPTPEKFEAAQALQKAGKFAEAEKLYRKILTLHPEHAASHHQLGVLARKSGRHRAAAGHFARAVRHAPKNALYRFDLAAAFHATARPEKAVRHFRLALGLRPDHARTHHRLANALAALGDFDAAAAHYQKALELEPRYTPAYLGLAEASLHRVGDPLFDLIRKRLRDPKLDAAAKADLHFALTKMFDDCDDFDRAFAHARIANQLTAQKYSQRFGARTNARIKAVFTRQFFEQRQGWGDPSKLPIFVIGVARSGKSLIENLLARLPGVKGADEHTGLALLEDELPKLANTAQAYPGCVAALDRTAIACVAERELATLREAAGKAKHVVTTTPSNFRRLGLIALLFPKARIIVCRRDPLDTGLAAYFRHFNAQQSHAGDLTHIGQYLRQFDDMMRHWRQVMPVPMLDVRYETLAADPVGECRKMADFCGLPWNDALLERPYAALPRRGVKAGDGAINSRQVGRWRHYKKYLGPLQAALQPGES